MRRLTIVFTLLISCGTALASDEVDSTVRSYIADFNSGHNAKDLVGKYWNPVAMIVSPTEVLGFNSHQDAEKWMAAIQVDIQKAGWLKSEFVDTATCQLSDTVALYSFRFKRVFRDGREVMSGGTYTLYKSDRWRITTLVFVEPPELWNCNQVDA